jgi:hypothetical protein
MVAAGGVVAPQMTPNRANTMRSLRTLQECVFLFTFMLHKHDYIIMIHPHIKNYWPATDLAIFNVILMIYRGIQKHFN